MRAIHASAVLVFSLSLAANVAADDSIVRTRDSFNDGWKFARFGPMSDGSMKEEPGAARRSIGVKASSEEAGNGNTAEMAFDGDMQTRWCASGGGLNEWLMLDLGSELPVEGIEVDWEFPDRAYEFAIEWSDEGEAWNRLATGTSRDKERRL